MGQNPPPAPSGRPNPNPPRQKKPDALAPMRTLRFWITLAILFAANILISNILFSAGQAPTVTISYNAFLDQVTADNVVSITSTGESITGVTKKALKDTSGTSSTKFQTQRPAFANDDLETQLRQHNVVMNAKDPNASTPLWETLLFSFGPTILLVVGFLYLSRRAASEFVESIVGAGAARVRDLFAKARAAEPAIIFIDELAAIGRSRAAALRIGGNDEQEQTLNQILTEMDGFDSREGVIVLAATNRADVLDPALLRPGRFDRRVTVQPPDRRGRAAILRIHTRKVPLAPDADLDQVASQTPGLVGADLRNLVNEAALGAARKGESVVTTADFADAVERTLLGAERKIMLSDLDRERIAYHESGHALLGLLVPGADPVKKVTIVPRGQALGVTLQSPIDDRFNYGEDYLRARMIGALGGRAAEKLIYGVVTTGAENDLMQVTRIAQQMVVRWGMSPKVGPLNYGDNDGSSFQQRPYGEGTANLIDDEVRRISEECLVAAEKGLGDHRSQLDALARALLKNASLDEKPILSVTGITRQESAAARPAGAELAGTRPIS